jgi:hypothetical protein
MMPAHAINAARLRFMSALPVEELRPLSQS